MFFFSCQEIILSMRIYKITLPSMQTKTCSDSYKLLQLLLLLKNTDHGANKALDLARSCSFSSTNIFSRGSDLPAVFGRGAAMFAGVGVGAGRGAVKDVKLPAPRPAPTPANMAAQRPTTAGKSLPRLKMQMLEKEQLRANSEAFLAL